MKSFKLKIESTDKFVHFSGQRRIRRLKRKPHACITITVKQGTQATGEYRIFFGYKSSKHLEDILETINGIDSEKIYIQNPSRSYENGKLNSWRFRSETRIKQIKFIPHSFLYSYNLNAVIPFKSWKEVAKFKLKYQ